ncbi:SDR family NAD(P)-dependent oxidoreductase [Streptomyces mirabilis]
MLSSGCGSIVFTTSEAALRGSTAVAAYTASKQGIVSLTKSLAVPYRSEEIRTYAVAPDPTATNIRIETRAKAHGPPRLIDPYIGLSDKVAEPGEQAAASVFLASDAARNINRAVLPVDHDRSAIRRSSPAFVTEALPRGPG